MAEDKQPGCPYEIHCSERFDRIDHKLSEIKVMLVGNGKPERGIIVRMDRVEQRQRLVAWLGATIGTALIVTMISLTITLLVRVIEHPPA